MKFIISIILLFLFSTQSFADVKGKGIICIVPDKKDSEDKIIITTYSENNEVSLESKYIVIGNRYLLDRKNLKLHLKKNYASLFISNCILYKSKKALMIEFEKQKKRQQEIYNMVYH